MKFTLINSLVYTAAWFFGILLAARNHAYLAVGTLLFFLAVQFLISFHYRLKNRWCDVYVSLYACLIGCVCESFFLKMKIIHYVHTEPHAIFPPLWIVLLYPLFTTTFNHSFSFINNSRIYPIVVGALAPLSYLAGNRMGACLFPQGHEIAILGIGSIWMLNLSLLVALNRVLLKIDGQVDRLYEENSSIQMLYDKECPICSKEVDQLKLSAGKNSIDFIDISDKNYQAKLYQNLSYNEAMKRLYAIDQKGKILQGTDAFFAIYAKAGWKGLAIGLKAPLVAFLFNFGYKLFAKFRLPLTGRK